MKLVSQLPKIIIILKITRFTILPLLLQTNAGLDLDAFEKKITPFPCSL